MRMRFSLHSPNGGLKEVARIRDRIVQRRAATGSKASFWDASQLSTPEPFQVLACSAVATSRLKLGTAVSNMVYQDPTVLAGIGGDVERDIGRARGPRPRHR